MKVSLPYIDVTHLNMDNVQINKPGDKVFMVKFVGVNRGQAEKELQAFIAGRKYTRYVDHFNPNSQIIEIHDDVATPAKAQELA